MSPALIPNVSSANIASTGVPTLPVFSDWQNPLPDSISTLDGRRHYLQSENHRFLEMHPNGTRGVHNKTDYCILTILFYNITIQLGSSKGAGRQLTAGHPAAVHIIKGNKTGLYLCMDDKSVIFQSREFNQTYCTFRNEATNKHKEVYYRQKTPSSPKWYIGLNKDGTVRCGNTTKPQQKGVKYVRISAGKEATEHTTSPPFVQPKKECCKTKRCRRREKKNEKDRERPRRKRRRCYKNWCKKHRRRFFSLKLKDLKRYYNRCIKKQTNCHKQADR